MIWKVLVDVDCLNFQTKCRIQTRAVTSWRKISWLKEYINFMCQIWRIAFSIKWKSENPKDCLCSLHHGGKLSKNEDAVKLAILFFHPLSNNVDLNILESVRNIGPPEYSVRSFPTCFVLMVNTSSSSWIESTFVQ